MTIAQPSTAVIRSLLRRVIEYAPSGARATLLAQADSVEYVDGPVTMLRLRVTGDAAPARGVPNPVPGGPDVLDAQGDVIGLLLLWLNADGYIDCLEYGWVTDQRPTELPSPTQVGRP